MLCTFCHPLTRGAAQPGSLISMMDYFTKASPYMLKGVYLALRWINKMVNLVAYQNLDSKTISHKLVRDLHAQMEYVKTLTKCPDGKVLGLGHSMGGIILYAMLASRGKGAFCVV